MKHREKRLEKIKNISELRDNVKGSQVCVIGIAKGIERREDKYLRKKSDFFPSVIKILNPQIKDAY